MGIAASLTVLFVTGLFSTMFWLLARGGSKSKETPPGDSVAA